MSYGLRLIGSDPVELCDECGFDAREIVELVPELGSTLASLDAQRRRQFFEQSPQDGIWSGAEYAEHTVQVANVLVGMIEEAAGLDGSEPATDLTAAAGRIADVAKRLDDVGWNSPVDMGEGVTSPVPVVLAHLMHDASHHLWDVRRGIARLALRHEQEIYTFER